MPYILYKTDGSVLATVGDASLDTTTDLAYVGRNYSGYGQVVNENFVKLLENFAGKTPPAHPVVGELWFNTNNGRLSVNYDGVNFKSIPNLYVGDITHPPSVATTKEGDFWWDSTNGQLKAKHGSQYILVGPANPANTKSEIIPTEEYSMENQLTPTPFIKANIGVNTLATISDTTFTPVSGSTLYGTNFTIVSKGITIAGSDANGSSQDFGYYFWGTSTDSLKSNTSTTATNAMVVDVVKDNATDSNFYLTFVSTATGFNKVVASDKLHYNPNTEVLHAVATSARYADIAERYAADADYEFGTVLVIGGSKEVTTTDTVADPAVVGIVSQNPGFRLNSTAGSDNTHPYIALKGRVPCKVVGKIKKGDLLVTSSVPGHAKAYSWTNNANAVFAKALEANDQGFGIIEVFVV